MSVISCADCRQLRQGPGVIRRTTTGVSRLCLACDAKRRARWVITARSPRSAVAVVTVSASALKTEVARLQFTEHYLILSVEPA